MAMNKVKARMRRAHSTRKRIAELQAVRLCIYRTPRHIYAQVIDADGGRVLAAASTVEPEMRKEMQTGGNVQAAAIIGRRIAAKAKAIGVTRVAFDRSGFKYHGRIKALADAAREGGLEF